MSRKVYASHNGEYVIAQKSEAYHIYCIKQNDYIEISEIENDTFVSVDLKKEIFYCFRIENKSLIISCIPDGLKFIYDLSGEGEEIVGVVAGNNYIICETIKEHNDDEQVINFYIIDLKNNRIIQTQNKWLIESYHLPYITFYKDKEVLIIENASVYPYELDEACHANDFSFKNDIAYLDIQKFISSASEEEITEWNVLDSNYDPDTYLQVLKIKDNYLFYSRKKFNEGFGLYLYDIENKKSKHILDCAEKIDGIIINDLNEIYIYNRDWKDEKVRILNNTGELFVCISLNDYKDELGDIELHSIIAVLDEKYIVFDASEYDNNDDEIQIRMVFDKTINEFCRYSSALIKYKNIII